jgi:hypothetical protein
MSETNSRSKHPSYDKLFKIEDDLAGTWVEDWASGGVTEIEEFLINHAAFSTFLEKKAGQDGEKMDAEEKQSKDGGLAIDGASSIEN